MLPFRKIFFPVDYSEPCKAIVPYVEEMRNHFSVELSLVHAYGPEALAYSPLPITDPELPEQARALAEERLREFAQANFPGLGVEVHLGIGEPGAVIHDVVQHQGADLVMLPTHGRGPLRRFLLGSVTAKVLHDLTVPVWTGHPLRIPYTSILAAADARLVELKKRAGVKAPHIIIEGPVADAIHDEALRTSADLIVTGRGEVYGTFSRLWSHLYPIVRHAPCPVLSI